MSTLFYVGTGLLAILGVMVYVANKRYEEVSFIDKRTWKKVTRIRDKKTKKFV